MRRGAAAVRAPREAISVASVGYLRHMDDYTGAVAADQHGKPSGTNDEPVQLGDFLDRFIDEAVAAHNDDPTPVGHRYPKVRDPDPQRQIDPWIAWLVRRRDNNTCRLCGERDSPTEVDHVIPWSAGGSDRSTNLRTLCGPCNQTRSNYRLWETPRLQPVTLICDRCIIRHQDCEARWHRKHYDYPCPACHMIDLPVAEAGLGDPVDGTVAYCGCCNTRSMVTDPKRLL